MSIHPIFRGDVTGMLQPEPFLITFATPEGPISVAYDPQLPQSWVVPVGSVRIVRIEHNGRTFGPKNTAAYNPDASAGGGCAYGPNGGSAAGPRGGAAS